MIVQYFARIASPNVAAKNSQHSVNRHVLYMTMPLSVFFSSRLHVKGHNSNTEVVQIQGL